MTKNTNTTHNSVNKTAAGFTIIAGFYGFSGVLVGAITGHGERLAELYLQVSQMYFFFHTASLLAIAALLPKEAKNNPKALVFAGACFAIGAPAFSISLFLNAVLSSSISMLMPLGGTLMLLGWFCVTVYAIGKIFK